MASAAPRRGPECPAPAGPTFGRPPPARGSTAAGFRVGRAARVPALGARRLQRWRRALAVARAMSSYSLRKGQRRVAGHGERVPVTGCTDHGGRLTRRGRPGPSDSEGQARGPSDSEAGPKNDSEGPARDVGQCFGGKQPVASEAGPDPQPCLARLQFGSRRWGHCQPIPSRRARRLAGPPARLLASLPIKILWAQQGAWRQQAGFFLGAVCPGRVRALRAALPVRVRAALTLAEVHFLYWKLGGKQIN